MSSFIPIVIAHDAICEKGDEWLFHGMAKPYDVHGSLESPIDENDKNLLDKDMDEMLHSADSSMYECKKKMRGK